MKNSWILFLCMLIAAGSLCLHAVGGIQFGSGFEAAVQTAGRAVCGESSWGEAVQVFGASVTGVDAVSAFHGR